MAKINKLLIGAETTGIWGNIEYAKQMFKQGHRNKALKALRDAQIGSDFIWWHVNGKPPNEIQKGAERV